MQFRHIGLLLFLAAIPLQIYLMKYNDDFKDLTSRILIILQDYLLQLSNGVTGYVSTAGKCTYDFRKTVKTFLKLCILYYYQKVLLFRTVKCKCNDTGDFDIVGIDASSTFTKSICDNSNKWPTIIIPDNDDNNDILNNIVYIIYFYNFCQWVH